MKKRELKMRLIDLRVTSSKLDALVSQLRDENSELVEEVKINQKIINDLQKIIHSKKIPLPSIVQGGSNSVPLLLNDIDYWEASYAIYASELDLIEAARLTITDMINHFNNYISWLNKSSTVTDQEKNELTKCFKKKYSK